MCMRQNGAETSVEMHLLKRIMFSQMKKKMFYCNIEDYLCWILFIISPDKVTESPD